MSHTVSIAPCSDYSPARVRLALLEALAPTGGLGWVKPGDNIAIKVNLISAMKPEAAATTHPVVVTELSRLLVERGASVVVGDSPGGPWTSGLVSRVYNQTGMKAAEESGAVLNRDFGQMDVSFPEGKVCRAFPYTSYLSRADYVIDLCKLKTHGLTAMSCAVKNLFGVIPGTRKPEFHYLYPAVGNFADMLVDINEYVKPRLSIVDAVEAMEGNGPTQGTPRHFGAIIASRSSYDADLLCCELIGLTPDEAPTVKAAVERGLCPESWEKLEIFGDANACKLPDFKKQPTRDIITFEMNSEFMKRMAERCFGASPLISGEKCIACGECEKTCPASCIEIENSRAKIRRRDCIRCFCCQEFCPVGAITAKRPALARLLGK